MSCGVGEANHGQVQAMFLGNKLPDHGAIIMFRGLLDAEELKLEDIALTSIIILSLFL